MMLFNGNFDKNDQFYLMEAIDYELFPKIDQQLKRPFCNLGLWNIESSNADFSAANQFVVNKFGLGMVFARKYGIAFNWD